MLIVYSSITKWQTIKHRFGAERQKTDILMYRLQPKEFNSHRLGEKVLDEREREESESTNLKKMVFFLKIQDQSTFSNV